MRMVCSTDLSPEALAAARLCHALSDGLSDGEESVNVEFLHVLKSEWFRLDRGRRSVLEDPGNVARIEENVRDWIASEFGEEEEFEVVLREGKPAKEIAKYAAETDVDYLVVGQSGIGIFARMQLGSTANKLSQNPPCNLFITHRKFSEFQSPRRVVVGIDFEEVSKQALRQAARMARAVDAELDVVHVFDTPQPAAYPGGLMGHPITDEDMERAQDQARGDLDEFLLRHDDVLQDLTVLPHVLVGSPTRRIIEHTRKRHADLLCMGTVSKSALQTTVLGSVASGVVRHIPCTTLLVPPA